MRKYYRHCGDEADLCAVSGTGQWVCLCCKEECLCKACQKVKIRKAEKWRVSHVEKGNFLRSPVGLSAESAYVVGGWGDSITESDVEAAVGLATLSHFALNSNFYLESALHPRPPM